MGSGPPPDAITGTSDSQSCTYSYDDLMRSAGVSCGSTWSQTFTSDPFGNLSKSGSLSFAPTYSSSSNQFTLSGVSVQYDANGNLLTDNLNTYTWDPNWGTMTSVNNGSATVTAVYDAFGRAVELDGAITIRIVLSALGRVGLVETGSGLGLGRYYAFIGLPGGGTAEYSLTSLMYIRHADWLGSSRLTSTSSRTLYSSTAYAPFGEQYATAGTADASFTGNDPDTVSSLYDFMFRRLSPSQGRWISPDPSGIAAVSLTNPQTWNRYAYGMNNPLSNIDALGLQVGGCDAGQEYCDDGSGIDGGETAGGSGSGGTDCPNCVPLPDLTCDSSGTPCDSGVTIEMESNHPGGCDLNTLTCQTAFQNMQSIPYQALIPGAGGGGSAPSNATPWYKSCTAQALFKGAGTTALDAIGIIPEGGTISAAFSLFHGAAGVSNGIAIQKRVAFAAGIVSTAAAGSDLQGPQQSTFSTAVTGLQSAVGGFGIAKGLIEDIPVAGSAIAIAATALDLVITGVEVAKCH